MWMSSAYLQCRFRALGLKVEAQFFVERVHCVLPATAVAMNATASWCNGCVRPSVMPCDSFAACALRRVPGGAGLTAGCFCQAGEAAVATTVPLKAEPIGSSGSNVLNKPVGGVAPDASYLVVESRVYRIDAVVRLLDPYLVLVSLWDVRFVARAPVFPDPSEPFLAV